MPQVYIAMPTSVNTGTICGMLLCPEGTLIRREMNKPEILVVIIPVV